MESVLLLNAAFQPLNIISNKKLVILMSREKIDFVDNDIRQMVLEKLSNRQLPQDIIIVRLLRNIPVPRRLIRPNRYHILLRDNNTCQYCGTMDKSQDMTIDHIVPISKGGKTDGWENRVTACKKCNNKKGNKLPHEAGLKLLRQPHSMQHEYAHILLLQYPQIYNAYQALLNNYQVQSLVNYNV